MNNALSQSVEQILQAQQLKEDFAILRFHLEQVSPGLYTYTTKATLDSIFNSIETQLEEPMSSAAFFKKLLVLNKPIANNHTRIEPSEIYLDYLATAAPRFPFTMYYGQDTLYLFADNSNEFSIGHGKRIKSINGVSSMEILHHFADHLPTDGYNRTYPLFVAAYKFSRMYAYLYGCPEKFDIEYWDAQNQLKTTSIQAITVAQIQANSKDRITHQAKLYDAPFAFEISGNLAILRVRTFQPKDDWSAAKFRRFLRKCFSKIQQAGVEKLLLDLRQNGGGFPEAADELLAYLIDHAFQPYQEEYALVNSVPQQRHYQQDFYIKHFNNLRKEKKGHQYLLKGSSKTRIKPKSTLFKGQLFVLINEQCASAATTFIGQLKTHTDAIFIGREPGGNSVTQTANDLPTLILPNSKVKAIIPLVKSTMNVNWQNDGYGVQPDLIVVPTVTELLQQEDHLLQKVIQLIKTDRVKSD